MNCYACDTTLTPDTACPDTEYQFDNALWIQFSGGYGMFVDNLAATMPNNTEDQWVRLANGEYLTNEDGQPIVKVDYAPTYIEERMLQPPADYEAVICHDCAHEMCAKLPWLERLLNTHGSHAHRTAWKDAHPDHYGWDYERRGDDTLGTL